MWIIVSFLKRLHGRMKLTREDVQSYFGAPLEKVSSKFPRLTRGITMAVMVTMCLNAGRAALETFNSRVKSTLQA
jgi:hypothetical protein